MKRVSIQGEPGSFSHEAALSLFGTEIELVSKRTFEELFDAVADTTADFGIVPIENSLAGSVHENYDRLLSHTLPIVAETMIRVQLSLIVKPGATKETIAQVASHPVALQQCRKFFLDHPNLEAVAAYDTAGSIRDLVRGDGSYDAAIGSELAATLYKGKVLFANIEDNSQNYTRFFAVAKSDVPLGSPTKTSIVLRLPNKPGSLSRALEIFARNDVDLAKLESRPIQGEPWQYSFYLDVQGGLEGPIARSIEQLGECSDSVRILGSYPGAHLSGK